jgi:hypothetical protein
MNAKKVYFWALTVSFVGFLFEMDTALRSDQSWRLMPETKWVSLEKIEREVV